MRRKIVMVVAALLCGALGTALLVRFVQGAESRALEGEQLVEVFVVTEYIPAGTSGSAMIENGFVEITEVPEKVRPLGSVVSASAIADQVALMHEVKQRHAPPHVMPKIELADQVEPDPKQLAKRQARLKELAALLPQGDAARQGVEVEVVEGFLQSVVIEFEAEFHHSITECVTAAVLSEHQVFSDESHIFRTHDFVGCAFLQHSVLVNPSFVGESVLADNGLVPLHFHAGD